MNPHCILGSSSALFRSIIGYKTKNVEMLLVKNISMGGKGLLYRDATVQLYATVLSESYNRLLLQHCSFKVSLLPELRGHHDSNLFQRHSAFRGAQ